MPDHVAAPATRLHAAVASRIADVIRVRLPDLPHDDVHRAAVVSTQIFGSLLARSCRPVRRTASGGSAS